MNHNPTRHAHQASYSSSSLSSGASSMLQPARRQSNSSQSDITGSEYPSGPSPQPYTKGGNAYAVAASPAPRSSSLALNMGSSHSRTQQQQSGTMQSQLSNKAIALGNTAAATGLKLRRAFAGRRKASADSRPHTPPSPSSRRRDSQGKERQRVDSGSTPSPAQPGLQRQPSAANKLTLNIASHVLSGMRRGQNQPPLSPDDIPPPPPPKPPSMMPPSSFHNSPPRPSNSNESAPPQELHFQQRASVMVPTPGINPAIHYMRRSSTEEKEMAASLQQQLLLDRQKAEAKAVSQKRSADKVEEGTSRQERPSPPDRGQVSEGEKEGADTKADWRKSDSTMSSHHTIRPGAGVGSWTPRPLSFAESLQSTHTIVPAAGRRVSAVINAAELSTPEEAESSFDAPLTPPSTFVPPTDSPSASTTSLKSKKRRSLSLNLGASFGSKAKASPPTVMHESVSTPTQLSSARSATTVGTLSPMSYGSTETPTLSRTAANGVISSVSSDGSSNGVSGDIQVRLASYAAGPEASTPSPTTQARRQLPAPPPQHPPAPRRSPDFTEAQAQQYPAVRPPAVSISSGFAPAAGLAKRAVEKMGRAWEGRTWANPNGAAPVNGNQMPGGAYTPFSETSLGRFGQAPWSSSNKGKGKRTPADSGSWSVQSSGTGTSSSLSDSDAFMAPAGPVLGTRLRGPARRAPNGAGVAGGIVFGRPLQTCVAETAVRPSTQADSQDADSTASAADGSQPRSSGSVPLQPDVCKEVLESRRLPALVVRCTQHLMAWGVQEEGLFRVSGRPSHVAKIRTEFDTGADYNLVECSPGELDPHAVSSILKAFLRELPEPILTRALMPYFDAALSAEVASSAAQSTTTVARGARGPGLPTGPKSGSPIALRKPPSLSTLAMPTFAGARPASDIFLNALSALVARLPEENRDLLRTVVDLIKSTASRFKVTKMPLSNLLLVFTPSMNMSPPLLRALCEAQNIWDGPLRRDVDPVVNSFVPRESVVLDIRGTEEPVEDGKDENRTPSTASTFASPLGELESVAQSVAQLPSTPHSRPSTANVDRIDTSPPLRSQSPPTSKSPISRGRTPQGSRPLPRPPVRAQTSVPDNFGAVALSEAGPSSSATDSVSLNDADSYHSASEGASITSDTSPVNVAAPPDLTSSAESLPTSSETPSFTQLLLAEDDDLYAKPDPSSVGQPPAIAESSSMPLPTTPHNINVKGSGGGIEFPSVGSVPTTPSISRRKSIPFLSLPGSPVKSDASPSSPASARLRVKRPSLHLLFNKRSESPLRSGITISSPYLQPNSVYGSSTGSSPTGSSPLSNSSAPALQQTSFSLPPQLDLPIDSTPWHLDLDSSEDKPEDRETNAMGASVSPPALVAGDAASLNVSIPSNPSSGLGSTPIADRYCSPDSFSSASEGPKTVEPLRIRPKASQPSVTADVLAGSHSSTDRLGQALADKSATDDDDDWARSVSAMLLAADHGGVWHGKDDGKHGILVSGKS